MNSNALAKSLGSITWFLRTNYLFDGKTLTVKPPFRKAFSLRIDELDEIGIETTDQGPFIEDVFLILCKDTRRIRIGDPAPVFQELVDAFGDFEAFDWQSFGNAMNCTENRYFLCWQRPGSPIAKPS